jgi:hypothetical protein
LELEVTHASAELSPVPKTKKAVVNKPISSQEREKYKLTEFGFRI